MRIIAVFDCGGDLEHEGKIIKVSVEGKKRGNCVWGGKNIYILSRWDGEEMDTEQIPICKVQQKTE